MFKAFQDHIAESFPFLKGKRLLIACSGGLDSVTLTHLMHGLNFETGLAHCNFSLRGTESDEDAEFVADLAERLNIPVYIETFDTKRYAANQKLSTQMAARELRYTWFNEILSDFNYDYVLTAHHADDDLETFLINLSRGTGIRGLTGINAVNERIVRPLLPFTRSEILAYAKKQNYFWREDSSNSGTDYLRNQLRKEVIPPLKNAVKKLLPSLQKTQGHLRDTEALLEDYMTLVYQLAITEESEGYSIDILKLSELPNTNALLYELLYRYGFSAWEDIAGLLSAQSGKQIFSETHRLLKDRNKLLLTERDSERPNTEILIFEDEQLEQPISISFKKVDKLGEAGSQHIYADRDLLQFPLVLRRWREGDVFQPFGMAGKKKLSKFFKDEKLSLVTKEKIYVLCSNNQVLWVVGYRMDDRFKVTAATKQILRISTDKNLLDNE